jgi:hypothetical protein
VTCAPELWYCKHVIDCCVLAVDGRGDTSLVALIWQFPFVQRREKIDNWMCCYVGFGTTMFSKSVFLRRRNIPPVERHCSLVGGYRRFGKNYNSNFTIEFQALVFLVVIACSHSKWIPTFRRNILRPTSGSKFRLWSNRLWHHVALYVNTDVSEVRTASNFRVSVDFDVLGCDTI